MIWLSIAQRQNIGFQYVLDLLEPASPYGREALRDLRPALPGEEARLEREFDNIEKTMAALTALERDFDRLEHMMRSLRSIRGSIGRCGGEMLSDVDLFEIKRFLLQLAEIQPLVAGIHAATHYRDISLLDTSGALELLDPEGSRTATFYISDQDDAELSAVREAKRQVEQQLRELSDAAEEATLMQRRGELAAREQAREDAVRSRLSKALLPYVKAMLHNADAIGQLDLTLQKAKLALRRGACRPTFGGGGMRFVGLTNPQVADRLAAQGGSFTPLTLALGRGVTVITGANMGGKSVALKTVALNVLLVHCGFYPFAQEATCMLFDSMHVVSEDLEATDRGLSSFGGEIVRLQEILRDMEAGFAFVLMDEFARGTNPQEGAAIARGVVAYLNTRDAVTLMSTHYGGVADLAGAHYEVIGLGPFDAAAIEAEIASMTREERVSHIAKLIDYGLVPVTGSGEPPRDALAICRLLGLDRDLMKLVEKHYKES